MMVSFSLHSLTAITFLAMLTVARAVSSVSPTADIICSKENETDCYPRIFEPTKDFQVIKEGQDLPPGLHVRLDIYSGLKEARLNIPLEGEESFLAEIPIEKAMVLVEQPEADETEPEEPAMRDRVHIKPPVLQNAGKIVPPPSSGDDFNTFQKAILAIKSEGDDFDMALDDLKDLSHDIYYGLETVKDGAVLEKLICLILGSGPKNLPASENGRDHKSASILASALQNNPTALKEVGEHKQMVLYPNCSTDSKTEQTNFVSILQPRLKEADAPTLKAKVTAISGLLKDQHIRDKYIQNGGMELLLALFLNGGSEFDIVRKRVIQLVTDTFLDEEMGAELGVWPKSSAASAPMCQSEETRLDGGCWEYHVEGFANQDEVAEDFLVMMKAQRAKFGGSAKEL